MAVKKIKLKKRNCPLITLDEYICCKEHLDVFQGSTKKVKVAVKRLRIRKASLFYRFGFYLSSFFTDEPYRNLKMDNTTPLNDIFKEIYIMNRVGGHESILKLFDFRISKYHFSIVMELCACTLETLFNLSRNKDSIGTYKCKDTKTYIRMPTEYVLHLMAPIASALEHMHSLKFVHLDIKPDNIFITRNGVPKLSDFDNALPFKTFKKIFYAGTPNFVAPEMYFDKVAPFNPNVDIFAFGATCSFCVYKIRIPRKVT